MSREIKFRAWDKNKSEMMDSISLNLLIKINFRDYELNNYEFMQYTGLIDKNGKEIYEGDIVESMLPRNKFFDDIAKVVFRKGSFMMKSVEFEDETSCLIDSEQFIEVIGNIYENNELLNVET